MALWLIEPHDPLIVRDGRPFGPNPGARARSVSFPYPSTVAGGFRSQAGKDENGRFDRSLIPAVKQISIRGPLLVELLNDDNLQFLAPAPRDALLLRENDQAAIYRRRLQPLTTPDGVLSDLPDGLSWLVGLPQPDLKKPAKEAPRYWYWESHFVPWLLNPPNDVETVAVADLGHNGPTAEWRVHVAIDPTSFTGADGALFATNGLEFWQRPSDKEATLSHVKRLALATEVNNPPTLSIRQGFAPWGGERRTMHWRKHETQLPAIPVGLANKIAQTGCCRLILITPACFSEGWKPSWVLEPCFGVTPTLEAVIVNQAETISGWNFELKPGTQTQIGPKPTRRLVSSGSVYFLRLDGDPTAVRRWVEGMWLANVSDTEEDRLAGFGLTAVGFWDGTAQPMQISSQEANHG